jgi:hypothetical protein
MPLSKTAVTSSMRKATWSLCILTFAFLGGALAQTVGGSIIGHSASGYADLSPCASASQSFTSLQLARGDDMSKAGSDSPPLTRALNRRSSLAPLKIAECATAL